MNIARILAEQAAHRGDAPALIHAHRGHDRVLSFSALESASARIAGLLRAKGIGAGDRVLILHPMTAELYAFLIALFRIGAAGMFLDPSAGREFVKRCLLISPPQAFFSSARAQLLRLWIPALRDVRAFFCTGAIPGTSRISLATQEPEMNTIVSASPSAPALITFTSGSTGEPKAALRTHSFLIAQHRALRESLHHRAGTLDLTTLPVFVLANLASGVTSVIPDADIRRPGAISPRPVLRQIQRLSITTTAASPAFIARLVSECRKSGLSIPRLERVFMGGAPVFPEDLRQARAAFPNAEITSVYGSTEAEPMAEVALSSISDDDFEAMRKGAGLLAGLPVASIELRIITNQWGTAIRSMEEAECSALRLGPRSVGEIVVAGEHVLPGYLNGTGDGETKFRCGDKVWHRTGDLGWLDDRGRLWLMGRASAAIADQRGNLYPFAVECAARQIEGVRCAAILAIAGRRVLVLEGRADLDTESVRNKIPWAALDEVRILPKIPLDKRHNAKVDYVTLRRIFSAAK